MLTDRELWCLAQTVIGAHGSRGAAFVADKIEERRTSDAGQFTAWREVAWRIEQLQPLRAMA